MCDHCDHKTSEYWNPKYETMSRDELTDLQNRRLVSQVHR